jgi:hypothetical protein
MRKNWLPAVVALGIAVVLVGLPRPRYSAIADDAKPKPAYVGSETCKKCHLKQFKSWSATAMSQGLSKLAPNEAVDKKKAGGLDPAKDYTKDPKCLACHVTGYGTESGYPASVEGKAWTPEEEARAKMLSGTGCEACHGPGSLYIPFKKANQETFKTADIVALGATQPPTVEQCMVCHKKECPTMPADYAWDFEKGKASKNLHEHFPLKNKH